MRHCLWQSSRLGDVVSTTVFTARDAFHRRRPREDVARIDVSRSALDDGG